MHNGNTASSSSLGNGKSIQESESELESDDQESISTLSSSEEEEEEESPDELSSEDEKQKQVYKADITPNHRAEKRPQRGSAARANHVWSQLTPSSSRKRSTLVPEVVIYQPSTSSRSQSKSDRKRANTPVVEVETPTKNIIRQGQLGTPKEKDKAVEKRNVEVGIVCTPTKKQKVITPRKKPHPVTPTSATVKARALARQNEELGDKYFIRPTSSDAYFANQAPRSYRKSSKHQTSDNTISRTLPFISTKAINQLSAHISHQLQGEVESANLLETTYFDPYYDYWWSLLVGTNRPLVVYGIGSKRAQLQHFASVLAGQGRCASVVVRGESGGRIEDVVRELEGCIKNTSNDSRKLYSTPLEARARSLVQALEEDVSDLPPAFLVLIHNFDTSLLLQERSLYTLAILSTSNRIHICVDTCQVNSSLLEQLHGETEQERLSWLWINMNTYVPMSDEIINERGIGTARALGLSRVLDIRSAGGGGHVDIIMDDGDQQQDSSGHHILSEKRAIQILGSTTDKARNLFIRLADSILKDHDKEAKIKYSDLFTLALSNYLATTREALRQLMVEFHTHNLIRIEAQGASHGETNEQNQGLAQVNDNSLVSIAMTMTDLNRVCQVFRGQK